MPTQRKISDKVSATLGFDDGHVEVGLKVPIIGTVTLRIEPDELYTLAGLIGEAVAHIQAIGILPEKAAQKIREQQVQKSARDTYRP